MKQLTPREVEVLNLISSGDTSHIIASKLFISARTVDKHTEHVKRKLDAKNIAHAVRLGIIQGYIDIFPVSEGVFKDDTTHLECIAFPSERKENEKRRKEITVLFNEVIDDHIEQNGVQVNTVHVDEMTIQEPTLSMSGENTIDGFEFSDKAKEAMDTINAQMGEPIPNMSGKYTGDGKYVIDPHMLNIQDITAKEKAESIELLESINRGK